MIKSKAFAIFIDVSTKVLDQFSVDANVSEREVADVLDDARLRDVVEGAVFEANVADGRVLEAAQVERVLALPALHVLHDHVADDGREAAALALLVVEVNGDDGIGHLADLDVAHVDVFEQAAARGVVLEAQRAVKVGAVHVAVFGEEVSDAAGDFAADGDAAVPVLHAAALNDYVLRRTIDSTTGGVAARLDGDAVVACVEGAVLDENVRAGFGVAAVVVRAVAAYVHSAHGDVRGEHWMNLPHRRVDNCDAFDEDVLAAVGLYELRPQVVALAEDSI